MIRSRHVLSDATLACLSLQHLHACSTAPRVESTASGCSIVIAATAALAAPSVRTADWSATFAAAASAWSPCSAWSRASSAAVTLSLSLSAPVCVRRLLASCVAQGGLRPCNADIIEIASGSTISRTRSRSRSYLPRCRPMISRAVMSPAVRPHARWISHLS